MTIKNYTTHPVVILNDDEMPMTFIPSDGNIRIAETIDTIVTHPPGIKIKRRRYSKTDFLPPKMEDTLYIVSSVVCQMCPDREDFVIPFELRKNKGIGL